MSEIDLKPLFKYPGGKSTELKHFMHLLPTFSTYIEPFLGGGALYWALPANKWVVNDSSEELILIYQYTQLQEPLFLQFICDIAHIWKIKNNYEGEITAIIRKNVQKSKHYGDISSFMFESVTALPQDETKMAQYLCDAVLRKQKTLHKISKTAAITNWTENALGALGGGVYSYLRDIYNHTELKKSPQLKAALYLFLREYCYSSMFRFNKDGGFNVPFGGNSYAPKSFHTRLNQITDSSVINKLKETQILKGDFSDAIIDADDTFMFLDPPYDSEFSTYNLQVFDSCEQVRLRDELKKLEKTKWLMIVKSTEFIEALYDQEGWYKQRFDKSYSVNFQNRNDKNVSHLIVTNYDLETL